MDTQGAFIGCGGGKSRVFRYPTLFFQPEEWIGVLVFRHQNATEGFAAQAEGGEGAEQFPKAGHFKCVAEDVVFGDEQSSTGLVGWLVRRLHGWVPAEKIFKGQSVHRNSRRRTGRGQDEDRMPGE